MTAERRPIYEK